MTSAAADLNQARDPFQLFAKWSAEARLSEPNDPEAMALSTVDPTGMPDVRMVLCKAVEPAALVFYTNAESAKGRQIEASGKAAALFHWKSLRRQVRFRGSVSLLGAEAADAYFTSRPRISQIGAWASQQSRPVDSRVELEARVADYEARFRDQTIPRPDYWRGFRLLAEDVELWADGAYRLHDRVRFRRVGGDWARQRLFP